VYRENIAELRITIAASPYPADIKEMQQVDEYLDT
jgi:hypothetical protein